MSRILRMLPTLAACTVLTGLTQAATTVVVIEGLGGNDRYATEFDQQVDAIATASQTLSPEPTIKLFRTSNVSRDEVHAFFGELASTMTSDDQLIVYLIGHGSFDDHEYKFNIAGPDLTDADLQSWLDRLPSRNQVVVNTSSASGAVLDTWESESRVVITATKSGVERHATRFGMRFAAALSSAAADIDKNQIVTVQEAFDFAERGVSDFFEGEGRLATEHPRLVGERAARFSLARLDVARPISADARLAELAEFRDAINSRIADLRLNRDTLPASEYQEELFRVMLELAEAEEAIERRQQELGINER